MAKKPSNFNYRTLSVLGVVFIGAGAVIQNDVGVGLGIVLLIVGLAHRHEVIK